MAIRKIIQGISLDAEGVIFEFEKDGHHTAHLLAGRDAGIDLSLKEALELIPNLVGGPGKIIAEQFYELIVGRDITPKLTAEEIQKRSRFYFEQRFEEIKAGKRPIQPRPGFLETLEKIRGLGLKVMVGSSTLLEEFWVYWEKTGLNRVFKPEEVVLADESNGIRHKPEPDIFLETARGMKISPSEQLVIEDSIRGVRAARRAGSPVIGMTVYDRPAAIIPLYLEGAVRVFSDWREVNLTAVIQNLNNQK